jgi:hypothetical protein
MDEHNQNNYPVYPEPDTEHPDNDWKRNPYSPV